MDLLTDRHAAGDVVAGDGDAVAVGGVGEVARVDWVCGGEVVGAVGGGGEGDDLVDGEVDGEDWFGFVLVIFFRF